MVCVRISEATMNSRYILRAYLSITLFCSLAPARGQSLPSKTEAADRLKSVMQQVNLHNPDLPPFHLKAKIHYEVNKQVTDAEYELYWAAPDRFRREYRTGGTADIDLVVDGKRYVVRPEPEPLFPLVRLNDVMFSPLDFLDDTPKVNKVRSKKVGGAQQTCINADQEFYTNEICFDGATSDVVSATSVYMSRKKPRVTLEDFAVLGPSRYPRQMSRRFAPGTLEIKVDILAPVTSFADGVFTPAPPAVSIESCANPQHSGRPPTLTDAFGQPYPHEYEGLVDTYPEALDAYYILVGPDGRVEKEISVFPFLPIDTFFRNTRFPIYSCAGRPIEYEAVYIPSTHAPRPGEILLR
jgi:hypothetical protein